jgi:integrase
VALKIKGEAGKWLGGYVSICAGKKTYYIRRSYEGVRYDVSTRCNTLRAALKQLEAFEKDPSSFSPGGDTRPKLVMDSILVERFLAYSAAPLKDGGKQNTPKYVGGQKADLAWWTEKLRGKDLRKLHTTLDLDDQLEGAPRRAHKIRVIKTFFTWLREKRRVIELHEDPTFKKLGNPQSESSKEIKAIPIESYEAARPHAEQPWRDCMDVQAGTNWHYTELERFANGGHTETYFGKDKGVSGVLVSPWHKGGDPLRTPVSKEVLEAGKRILALMETAQEAAEEQARPPINYWSYRRGLRHACRAAGITPFNPGVFRHSGSDYAIAEGATMAEVATFNVHKSERTTRKFYARTAVPKKIPTMR